MTLIQFIIIMDPTVRDCTRHTCYWMEVLCSQSVFVSPIHSADTPKASLSHNVMDFNCFQSGASRNDFGEYATSHECQLKTRRTERTDTRWIEGTLMITMSPVTSVGRVPKNLLGEICMSVYLEIHHVINNLVKKTSFHRGFLGMA